jgi:hypothetical protein
MYDNVILGLVGVIIVAVEKKYVLHILSVCLYPEVSGKQSARTV